MTGSPDSGEVRPHRFDAFGLARREGEIAGTVDAFTLERVEDRLAEDGEGVESAQVAYRITGATDGSGQRVLRVALDGAVAVDCQRCLRPFAWPVHQDTTLLLARDERELAQLDEGDEREVLLAAGPVDPVTIVEDELLLCLPYVPRCDRPDCLATDAAGRMSGDADEAQPSPFDGLAALKRDKPTRD